MQARSGRQPNEPAHTSSSRQTRTIERNVTAVVLAPSLKKMLAGVVPGLLLAAAYGGKLHLTPIPGSFIEYLQPTAYLLFAITGALGWFFNRQRVLIAMAMAALAFWLVGGAPAGGALHVPADHLIVASVAFWLPLNLMIVALLPESRALFHRTHIGLLTIVLAQCGGTYFLLSSYPEIYRAIILFPAGTALDISEWTPLPIPALITSLLAFLVVLFRILRRFDLITLGLFWLLSGWILAMDTFGAQPYFSLFVTLGSLILAVALLQTWYDIAYLDQLTGLPGRLALNELARHLKGNYTVAMVDVDFFKKFNDTYGHDVGDQILKLVASKLRQVTGGGSAFRYGGEEFTVVFPNRRVKDVFSHLSALREAIEETHMILRSKTRPNNKPNPVPTRKQPLRYLNVTVSIGIAESNDELTTPAGVLKAADEALYRAKERGRNRLSL